MKAIGIDLGTTHSLVAVVRDGRPQVLADERGDPLLPSAVAYGADGTVRVGRAAVAEIEARPDDVVLSVKRLLGRAVGEAPAHGPQRFVADEHVLRLMAGGRAHTPEQVTAEVLRALRARAETHLGPGVDRAVITVPANFHPGQREAVRRAARLAGLQVMRLLSDPGAVALAYGLAGQPGRTFAVFDLGGGTFDLSLLNVEDGLLEVLSAAGDDHLGGDDLDAALLESLLHEADVDPLTLTPADWRRGLLRARRTREALSDRLDSPFALDLPGARSVRQRVTRGGMERVVRPVLDRLRAPCLRGLADAGLRPSEVEAVVLSGAATRSPAVQRFVADLFEQRPRVDLDPEHVVALGAAIQADLLSSDSELRASHDLLLLDCTARWLGLEQPDGVVESILPRGSRLPASRVRPTAGPVHLLQGEGEPPEPHRRFASLRVDREGPVRFTLDADGVLRVSGEAELAWAHGPEPVEAVAAETLASVEGALYAGARSPSEAEAVALTEAITQLRAALRDADAAAIPELTAAVRALGAHLVAAPPPPRPPVEARGDGPFAGAGGPPDEPLPPIAEDDED
jgi:molecular chaperone HscA